MLKDWKHTKGTQYKKEEKNRQSVQEKKRSAKKIKGETRKSSVTSENIILFRIKISGIYYI